MAAQTAQLSQSHFAQGQLSAAEVEAQQDERLTRIEHSVSDDAPLATVAADVEQYYKLTAPKPNSGLLREEELDLAAELKMREAVEVAADKEEEDFLYGQARLRRIGEAVAALAEAKSDHPHERDRIVHGLEVRDPEGAQQLRQLLMRSASATQAAEREEVLRALTAVDFGAHPSKEAAVASHEASLAALALHGKQLRPQSLSAALTK